MSKRLLAFLLTEMDTVRVTCRAENCRAVIEMPLEAFAHRRLSSCPFCHANYNPTQEQRLALEQFAEAALRLRGLDKLFGVEFVTEEKEGR